MKIQKPSNDTVIIISVWLLLYVLPSFYFILKYN
jgi:hypothetical protein